MWQTFRWGFLVVAAASFLVAIISRVMATTILGVSPSAFLRFADTCLLFALAFSFFQLLEAKAGEAKG